MALYVVGATAHLAGEAHLAGGASSVFVFWLTFLLSALIVFERRFTCGECICVVGFNCLRKRSSARQVARFAYIVNNNIFLLPCQSFA